MYLVTDKISEKFPVWLKENTILSETSIRTYNDIIKVYLKSLGEDEITIQRTNLFLRQHMMPCYYSAIKYYYQFQEKSTKGIIKVKQKPPRPREIPKIIDVLSVADKLRFEDRMITLFILNTGCRCNEAFKVKLKDITREGKVLLRTKGEKYRMVKLPAEFNENFHDFIYGTKLLGNNEYVFYTNSKADVYNKRRIYWRNLNKIAKKELGKNLGTHDFRRICAMSIYIDSQNNIQLVQRILGHSDISTTMRYVQYAITEEDINQAARILHERLKRPQER